MIDLDSAFRIARSYNEIVVLVRASRAFVDVPPRIQLPIFTMKKAIPETPPEYDKAQVIERPDGFYWQSKESGKESGPFPTLLEAVEDMQYSADSDYEPGESVEQAEAEIGISDWVDPETGELAEEQGPRIEDH
ncbi:MAG TPA: hypothetical protein VMV87_06235 [Burkholderiales bacterium]|nr:hypothetical protein [Burkholderiales bacterium]